MDRRTAMSLSQKIQQRLDEDDDYNGGVFIPMDFLDLDCYDNVAIELQKLVEDKVVDSISTQSEIYNYPEFNRGLNIRVPADPYHIAQALGRRTRSRVSVSGAMAANQLGLSTQVPMNTIYWTEGLSTKVEAGGHTIILDHVPRKKFPIGFPMSIKVIQALYYIGEYNVGETEKKILKRQLSKVARRQALLDARYTDEWIVDFLREIV